MDKLELVSVLEVAVFGLAIAQMLTILLTIRRDRDVKELGELVEEQRLRLAELRAWLAGRSSLQSRRTASEIKPDIEPAVNAGASESTMRLQGPQLAEDDLARAAKSLEWQREVTARLKSGITTQQITGSAENGFKWFKDDPNEPREIAEARRAVNGKTYQPVDQSLPEGSAAQPHTHVELERTLKAIRSLKEDTNKSATNPNQKPEADLK
jgi:hypothetical protein